MSIFICKTVHIFGFVAWFAGLFYLVRMFVYHVEAQMQEEPAQSILVSQYELMEARVIQVILNPALIITWLAGLGMIYEYGLEWFGSNSWLHIKLVFLLGLTAYHGYCIYIAKGLRQKRRSPFSSMGFRLFNEVPTLFLIIISALAVFKSTINYGYLISIIIITGILLILLTKIYKKLRDHKTNI